MTFDTIRAFFKHPLARAGVIHLALLGGGWAMAVGIAAVLGLSVSLLGILLGYALVNIGLTGWLLRRRPVAEADSDEAVEALAAFAEEPLGGLVADAGARLAKARRAVGRSAPMYRPLDRLVRTTRKIERRLALEPALRPAFARSLGQDLPLIATTAEQYVRLSRSELPEGEPDSLIVTEGVLREAALRLEALAESDGKIDSARVGVMRMDAHAEVLAQRLSADPDAAARRATGARVSHRLRLASKSVADDALAARLRDAARDIDALEGEALSAFVRDDAAAILADADALLAAGEAEDKADLVRRIDAIA